MENLINKLYRHKNIIANVFIDEKNKLIASSGWDGQILIQKENTIK